ncbi:MAG: hypothetical protein KF804_03755 [Burkholderiales bacterium]|jgi:hypothetical protein|nr:hypothetical protein [Burkholderiales bacterium]
MRALLLMLLIAALPAAHAAELAGRLFYTPDQRAQLDQLRAQKAVASQVRDEPVPETVTYNGIIRRSDGKTTIWMNKQPMSAAELRSGQAVTGTVSRDGRIVLQNPAGNNGKVELKVGQSATLLSGKVDESFAQQRPPAPDTKSATETKPAADAAKSGQVPAGAGERPGNGTPEAVSR